MLGQRFEMALADRCAESGLGWQTHIIAPMEEAAQKAQLLFEQVAGAGLPVDHALLGVPEADGDEIAWACVVPTH